MTVVAELHVAGPVQPWREIGLVVDDGRARIGGIDLVLDGSHGQGITSWVLAGAEVRCSAIDGLATRHVDAVSDVAAPAHPLGVSGYDHLVVMTSTLERTCSELEGATGAPLKRVREAGSIRQGFHRLGDLIVEVVESDRVDGPSASFWGFVWNAIDLERSCEVLGDDVISRPKPAAQQGRSIATFRSAAGLGVPVAIMSV